MKESNAPKIRLLVIANVNSSHTQKWCLALTKAGVQVGLFSINDTVADKTWLQKLDFYHIADNKNKNPFTYLGLILRLRKIIKKYRPQIVHSHYVTNYTALANSAGFPLHVATAWGSDIFVYPRKNAFNAWLMRVNLKKAGTLVSTSECMALEMRKYTGKKVHVIPFGVDLTAFKPGKETWKNDKIVIACFKSLEPNYAQDVLLQAFYRLTQQYRNCQLKLILAGEGSLKSSLREETKRLGLEALVEFRGWIAPSEVPAQMLSVDICVYLSKAESFGVSLLEAMACKVPLVVTPAAGFREVSSEGKYALFTEFNNAEDTAAKISQLISQSDLRNKLTESAYRHVLHKYDLEQNIKQQIELYRRLLAS